MSSQPEVYAFDHPHAEPPRSLKDLLGGKGAGLAEMTSVLKMPVPPGFTVAVPVCRAYRSGGWPDGLTDAIHVNLARLETTLGRKFGDPGDPLLLAVRSGAAFSMPGMMDTVLNLGLNEDTVRGLATASGDDEFAYDSYRRFLMSYANTVLGADLKEPAESHEPGVDAKAKLAAVQALLAGAGVAVPFDPHEQLRGAVEAVFQSWDSPRAKAYRAREGIDENLGTGVNVQAMVFGNYGDTSGTGVVFTRNPNTGTDGAYGDFLPRAQGEDVVAGIARTLDISTLGEHLPGTDTVLAEHLDALERHYRDMCDVEFTIERGKVWILQTRVAKRGAVAAVRTAVRMVDDPKISLTRAEAVARVTPEQREAARAEILAGASTGGRGDAAIATGLGASPGRVSGKAVFSADEAADLADASEEPLILVREETSPEDVHGMGVSAGILTSHGGLVSHAAVVARGWGIPAVVGAENLTVTDAAALGADGAVLFQAGDVITIDGKSGEVWLGEATDSGDGASEDGAAAGELALARDLPELAILESWAAEL
ncbi:MAG TPA: PEP/pyruvate-binding domain-containing protein [Sporichthya sp.]|nr:PEP/pyruvate-binding domain-containing protein [Sporichthya sp.]